VYFQSCTTLKWVHTKCGDVIASLVEKLQMTFVCRRCLGSMKDSDPVEKSVIIDEGVDLEKVAKFCY
jgi:hypothetical protein